MKMTESLEDYLEAILVLQHSRGHVRSIDIVHKMQVSKPSVSIAMKKLSRDGYATMDDGHVIYLTPAGQELAECLYERHVFSPGS